jgi:hypothetical protein
MRILSVIHFLIVFQEIKDFMTNDITDSLSDFISRCLSDNQLTGEIPASIGHLLNLTNL